MPSSPLPLHVKVGVAARVWRAYLYVLLRNRGEPLPEFIARFGRPAAHRDGRIAPVRLKGAVLKTLRLGPWRPACLANALVLFRLLREQGDPAELVIGLPSTARNHEAHAWVELDGQDLGPFPGTHHRRLARFT